MVSQARKIGKQRQSTAPTSSPSWIESHQAPAPQTYAVSNTTGPCSGGCPCAGPWGGTQHTAWESHSSVHLAPLVSLQTQTLGAHLSETGLNSWLPGEKLWDLSSLMAVSRWATGGVGGRWRLPLLPTSGCFPSHLPSVEVSLCFCFGGFFQREVFL